MYTGGQKFGILTLISLSLKNKYKNIYVVKFEVLGSQNMKKRIEYIMSIISDPQINLNRLGSVKKS